MVLSVKKRLLWADYAKFLAMYLVVLGHADLPRGDFRNFIYLFHLPLFFLISGFFDNSQKYQIKDFLIHNVKLLIIPYVCFGIINIPFSWTSVYLHPELYPGINSIWEYFLCPLYGIILGDDRVTLNSYLPCGPLWFLVALFIMKCCFYFLNRFASVIKNIYVKSSFWAVSLIISIVLYFLFGNTNRVYSLDSTFLAMPFYMIGFFMKRNEFPIEYEKKGFSYVILILILVYILLIGLTNGYVDIDAGNYGNNLFLFYLNGIIGSYLILLLCGYITFPIKFVQYIGANTIIILGVHSIVLKISKFFLLYVFDFPFSSISVLQSVMYALVSFVLCFPIVVLINRYAPWITGKLR